MIGKCYTVKMATENMHNFSTMKKKIIGCGLNSRSLLNLRGKSVPVEPIIFIKPSSAYITEGQNIKLVSDWRQIYHEVELGVVIGKSGFKISEDGAMDHVAGYCLALDMTAQDQLNETILPQALPWALAKSFDTSCPVSRFIPLADISDPHNLDLWCKVNDVIKQEGNTNDMVFNIPQLIAFVSQFFTLEPGDLLLTGTPAGVGPVCSGDTITCGIKGIVSMQFVVE